ncbi:hypothetical protein HDU92_005224 [Lobulomyces angularis]|nr:hypothetical protein HDU92_005224 [Lobulomyces angularis]
MGYGQGPSANYLSWFDLACIFVNAPLLLLHFSLLITLLLHKKINLRFSSWLIILEVLTNFILVVGFAFVKLIGNIKEINISFSSFWILFAFAVIMSVILMTPLILHRRHILQKVKEKKGQQLE